MQKMRLRDNIGFRKYRKNIILLFFISAIPNIILLILGDRSYWVVFNALMFGIASLIRLISFIKNIM
jgi:hypothetical protein